MDIDGLLAQPLKRLRGGGEDFGDMGEQLFHDDEDDMMEPEPPMPEEGNEGGSSVVSAKEILKDTNTTRWGRPALPDDFDNSKDLSIQWTDMDVVSGVPLDQNPNRSKSKVVGDTSSSQVPVLRAYGVNEDGHSVALFIHGYTPYAYFALPAGFGYDGGTVEAIRQALDARLKTTVRSNQVATAAVVGVEYLDNYKSIMGYETNHTKFFKVYVSLPHLVPTMKTIMSDGISLPGVSIVDQALATQNNNGSSIPCFYPFECNVPFVLRYMVDRDISGAGWLTSPAKMYQIRKASAKETHCQVHISLALYGACSIGLSLTACLSFAYR